MRAKFLGALCGVALITGLSACGSSSSSTSSPSATSSAAANTSSSAAANTSANTAATSQGSSCPVHATVGWSYPIPTPSMIATTQAIVYYAKHAGWTLTSAVANFDPGKQLSDISTMLDQGIKVLIVQPIDTKAIEPVLARAKSRGVKVVTLGTPESVSQFGAATDVEPPNLEAATQVTHYLATKVGPGAKVAAILAPTYQEGLVARNLGFTQTAKAAGLQVVATQTTNNPSAPDPGRTAADAFKQQFGSALKGIFAAFDPNGLGAASATGDSFQPAVVSLNGDVDAIQAVRAGRLAATADFQPVAAGAALFYGAHGALCGTHLPATIDYDSVLITKSNVARWRPWSEQIASGFKVTLQNRGGQEYLDTTGLSLGS